MGRIQIIFQISGNLSAEIEVKLLIQIFIAEDELIGETKIRKMRNNEWPIQQSIL
ncbi:hypothetical protein [Psychrobacillus sp. MER TA 171]|nr:hypothetical protein [Psychrobacillus sp. MER TA 171]MCM3360154.1 hypothetical protein [Psychrobacillus sp. MER TA 171]NME07449.1 hypothetical protein [Psychrobacillus sp. BL-248-WT-3]